MPSNASVSDDISVQWQIPCRDRQINCESLRTTNVVLVDFVDQHDLPEGFGLLSDLIQELASEDDIAEVRREMAREAEVDGKKSLSVLRMGRGLSQTEFADLLGTSQAAVSRIEAGLQEPKLSTIMKISEVLEVDLNTVGSALTDG